MLLSSQKHNNKWSLPVFELGEKPQKNRAWKAAAKGLKKLCWAWIFPPVSAEYCMMFYDATGLWKKSWIFCGLQLAFYWQPTLIYIFVERLPISFWESQDCYSVCWNMRRAAAAAPNFLFSDSLLRYELHLMIPFSDAMCIFSSWKKNGFKWSFGQNLTGLSELYHNFIISRIYRRFEQYFFSAFIRHLTFIQNPSISVFLIVGHKSRMWCQTGLGKSFSEGNFFIAKKVGGAAVRRGREQ